MKSANETLLQALQRQRRQLSMRGVLNFSGIKTDNLARIGNQQALVELILNDSSITSFATLQPQKRLKSIIADNSKVQVLSGLSIQPRLSSVSLRNTPVSKDEYFRIELLVVVGPRLSIINGSPVTQNERRMAQSYPPVARRLVEAGWILQYPPPSKYDFIYLTKQFKIENVSKDEYNLQLPPPLPEKPPSSPVSPKAEKSGQQSNLQSPTQNSEKGEQSLEQIEMNDDLSFCDKVAAILRPLGFAIRNGPEMVNDITTSVESICDVVSKIESIQIEQNKSRNKK